MTLKNLSKLFTFAFEFFESVLITLKCVDKFLIVSEAVNELLNALNNYFKLGKKLAEHVLSSNL